jgi:hypothetical protein
VLFNILDLTAINAWVIYKESTGINIKRRDFILNLAEELRTKYFTSKTSPLTNLTPNTDDTSTMSSIKRKQCQISQCRN